MSSHTVTTDKCRQGKRLAINIVVAVLAVAVTGILLELLFRHLLFGPYPFMEKWRKPHLYADNDCSDDYWLLRVRFGAPPARRNDPLLGHVKSDITPGTYTHRQAGNLNGRTPVLLYGDSYANCITPAHDCFEGLFNSNTRFAEKYYLLNYGVASYGLDQIYLLYQNSIGLYDKPIVIFSFLDTDMDRCMLSLREGQKPYFVLEDSRLQLRGLPIDFDPQSYFDRRPPHIFSYVLNLTFFKLFPFYFDANSPLSCTRRAEKDVTRAILEEVAADLHKRKIRYVFFVFEGLGNVGQRPLNWRIRFLESFFSERRLPHIWARQALEDAVPSGNFQRRDFVIGGQDGHPNRRANVLLAASLMEWFYDNRID